MRISTGAFYDSVSRTIGRLQTELGNLTVSMGSGRRVTRPSDDPISSDLIARMRTELDHHTAAKRVLDRGMTVTGSADKVLEHISDGLRKAGDIGSSMAQSGATDQARAASAAEIRAIAESVLVEANTQIAGRYIFGGYQDREPPFTGSADSAAYIGDSGYISVPLGSGRTCAVSVPGDELLNFVNGDGLRAVPGVDADVFTALSDLADTIESGSVSDVQAHVDDVRTLQQHTLQLRGSLGSAYQRLEVSRDTIDDSAFRCEEVLGAEEGVDIVKAISDYAAYETEYKAVISTLARILALPTMFDLTR